MLSPLRELGAQPTPAALRRGLGRAYLLSLGALTLPGLLIGLPLGLLFPAVWSGRALLGLLLAALLCSGLALLLARRRAAGGAPGTPEGRRAGLQAAIQLASAPAVPLLLASTAPNSGTALLCLLALALLTGLVGWGLLSRWAGGRP